MTIFLAIVAVLSTIFSVLCAALYFKAARSLKKYQSIHDVEQFKRECEVESQVALAEAQQYRSETTSLQATISAQKEKVAQYQILLGKLRTATELHERIRTDTERARQLAALLGKLQSASQVDAYIKNQQNEVSKLRLELEDFTDAIGQARTASEVLAQVRYYQNYLVQIKADIEAVEEVSELHEFGFYKPRYDLESADDYKRRLEEVRRKQKKMLKEKNACLCHTEWTVDGDKREGQKMVNQQIKLMLRAFNGECDAAVSKVRYNNANSLETRVKRSFEAINKLGETKKIHLAAAYCQLKYDELYLAHEYQEKKQEEREEQQRIREQMKEEEKVEREIEQARLDAEAEERVKTEALEKARRELAQKEGQHTAKLESLVKKLELELQDAIDRKAKAIARAQLTRSGHVYILSNIGTFGDGVYKIGLTRRLEPLERVKELGGASVPFPFDVHAMIYCEDAPKLENTLHRHFATRRINMVNLRREFFRVTLDEVRAAVAEHFGHVTFVTVPQAEQYRKTVALLKDLEQNPAALQIA